MTDYTKDILLGQVSLKHLERQWSGLRRNDWNMIFVLSGHCDVYIDDAKSCCLEKGNYYLFPPGKQRRYHADKEFACYWCHITPSLAPNWKIHVGNCYIFTPPEQEYARTQSNIEEAVSLCFNQTPHWHTLARHLIEEIILRGNIQNSSHNIPPQILCACDMLSDPHAKYGNFSEIAKKIGMSRSVFFRMFRQYIRITPQQYRETRMLTQAANLLEVSSISLDEISEMSGFSDQCYFSRRFKAHFGVSPSEYRKHKL